MKELSPFFDLAIDMQAIVSPDGNLLKLNPAWYTNLGRTEHELLNKPFLSIVHPEDISHTQERLFHHPQGDFEARLLHHDGSYCHTSVRIYQENQGEPIFLIIKDITQQYQKIIELQDSQERLKIALSANRMGIWDWNMNKDILYWDDSMFSIFEVPKEKFTYNYEGIKSIFHPDDRQHVFDEIQKSVRSMQELDISFRIITPSKKIKYIAAKAKVTNNDPHNMWLTGVNWDITNQKEQEEIIKTQEAKIVTSSRLSSLGEMASGIAHEINNPLGIIQGRADQLKRRIKTHRIDETQLIDGLTNIESTCERIVRIIKGLRAFSRNAEDDPFIVVEINQVIHDVIVLISEKFKHHEIEIRLKMNFRGKILGRSAQLGQVLLNLLNNSFDAIHEMPERWIEISSEQKMDKMVLTITDSGKGIDKNVRDKIFQPFFTTKDVGRGTGLGLSISAGIVENHKGRIYIDSKCPNTRFIIEIPIAPDSSN